MNENENLVPKRRFKEFTNTGTWEQRKFSNIVNRVSQQSNDSNLPKVEFEDIISGEGRLNKDISSKFDGRKGTVFEPEFILYGKLRPYLKNWLFPNFKGIALGDFWVFEPNNSSSIFDYYLIQSDKYQTVANISSGTKMPRSDWKTVSETVFSIPDSINEQEKIGAFFKHLDNTIALHQRMSDKQKKLKANLLQMMFPRNGEKIPEVRLAGFAEDWSQRTLEDISDKVTEKNKAREFTETLTNSAEYGIISQSDYFDKDISNINNIDGYYVVRPDDFVYNPRISNFAPVGPIKRNNLNRIGIMSPLYYVFRPKRVDHTFLEKYFETSYWHIFMKMNGDSGARADRFAIKDTILKEMPIPYPIKEEQVKIGIFFNQLDKSIVLHQEKIAHLKVLKSTLLNKMFI